MQRNEKGIERVEEKEKEQVCGMAMKFDLDSPATAEKGKVRFYVQKESLLIIKEGRRSMASKAFSIKKGLLQPKLFYLQIPFTVNSDLPRVFYRNAQLFF